MICGAVAVLTAYARIMGRTVLAILGVVLAIWLLFTVIGVIISALKFLIWIGLIILVAAIVITLLGKLAKGR